MRRVALCVAIAMLTHISVAAAQQNGLGSKDRIPLQAVDKPADVSERKPGVAPPPIPACAPAPTCRAPRIAICTSKAVCHRSPADRPDIACVNYACTPKVDATAPLIRKQPPVGLSKMLKTPAQ